MSRVVPPARHPWRRPEFGRWPAVSLALALVATTTIGCEGGDPQFELETSTDSLTAPPYARIPAPTVVASTTTLPAQYDWVQWGLSGTSSNRKAGVNPKLVGDTFTKIGTGAVAQYYPGAAYPQFTWSGGTPTASATSPNGVGTSNVGTGFKVRVSVTPEVKTVNLYVTIYNAQATVGFSSASIPAASQTTSVTSPRKTYLFEVDAHSAVAEDGYVTVKMDKSLGSGAFIALHGVALVPWASRPIVIYDYGMLVTPPANAAQPPLYALSQTDRYAHPLTVTGSTVSLTNIGFANTARESLYGAELWVDGQLVAEVPAANLMSISSVQNVAGAHLLQVGLVGTSGIRVMSAAKPFYIYGWATNTSPKTLADNTCVNQPLVVSSNSLNTAEQLDLSFSINHTWDGDLDMYLISPSGKTARVVGRAGGSGQNFSETRIQTIATMDLGLPNIEAASAPFSSVYGPMESLIPMYGEPMKGTWTFQVCDRAGGDVGTLNWARLYIAPYQN